MRARIRDTDLYFDVDGMGLVPDGDCMRERPVIFLLHGGPGGDHASFKSRLPALTDTAQLVYVDHRGSGRSLDSNPESWTLDNNIDDIDALREHLGLETICLLGSSYGGMVAQGYAIRYPQRLSHLILVATAPSHRFLADAQRIVDEQGTDDQKRVCRMLWDGTFETQEQLAEYYQLMGPWYARSFDVERFASGWNRGIRNFEQLNRGFNGFLKTFDFTEQLSGISCPTLVLSGAHDWICPVQHGRLIAQQIPRAHFKVFPNSAHALAEDEPDAFLAVLRGFLTHTTEV